MLDKNEINIRILVLDIIFYHQTKYLTIEIHNNYYRQNLSKIYYS